ncbi:hypothetical protein N2152v2_004064 [Parachlorella kessleri]
MFPQPGPGGQPSAQQQQQQQLQRLIAMGAIPAMAPLPGAGLALQAGFQQASQLQLQAALAQNPALQAQFAQQLQQQALMAQRASLVQQAGQAQAVPAMFPAAGLAAMPKVPLAAAAAGPPASMGVQMVKSTGAAGAVRGPMASKGATGGAAAAAVGGIKQGEAAPAKRAGSLGLKKRKAADARLIDKVSQLVPESPLFTAMQDAERRADLLISCKKSELQEMYASFRRGPPGTPQAGGAVRKKLRVYLFNEHAHQDPAAQQQQQGGGAAAPAAPSGAPAPPEPPSWALHIQGRLVDAGEPPAANAASAPHQPRHPFTHYIRRLQVQLDPQQYPGPEGRVLWEKSRHDREHRDSFEIRRRGSQPCQATILLELDYQPQQYSVSPPLSSLLGLSGLHSLPFIMQLLWGYIKKHGLYQSGQEGAPPLLVRCDEKMRAAFGGAEAIPLTEIQDAVRRACKPPEAATIQYQIRVDGPSPTHPDCYDFDFEVPLGHELPPFAAKTAVDAELAKVDQALGSILVKLHEHKRRRTFLMAFAQNPVDVINALIASQARELRLAASRDGESLEVLAAGDVFREKWVEDAVMRYLQRRMGATGLQ